MGKKAKGKSRNRSVYKQYEGGTLKNAVCPKCGPGFSLSAQKTRSHCGKCGYSQSKSAESKAE